jgi:hypothetical protein
MTAPISPSTRQRFQFVKSALADTGFAAVTADGITSWREFSADGMFPLLWGSYDLADIAAALTARGARATGITLLDYVFRPEVQVTAASGQILSAIEAGDTETVFRTLDAHNRIIGLITLHLPGTGSIRIGQNGSAEAVPNARGGSSAELIAAVIQVLSEGTAEDAATTRVRHTLVDQGSPHNSLGRRITRGSDNRLQIGGPGQGLCSCGSLSTELGSNYQRKAWHRGHKADTDGTATTRTRGLEIGASHSGGTLFADIELVRAHLHETSGNRSPISAALDRVIAATVIASAPGAPASSAPR